MVLEPNPIPESLTAGTKVTGLSAPDEEHVRTATVNGTTFRLVSARRATERSQRYAPEDPGVN